MKFFEKRARFLTEIVLISFLEKFDKKYLYILDTYFHVKGNHNEGIKKS